MNTHGGQSRGWHMLLWFRVCIKKKWKVSSLEVIEVDYCVIWIWQRCYFYTDIKPVPESSKQNYPKLPFTHRAVSLISCVYKWYSSLLNCRPLDQERTGQVVDEQNEFRKARACTYTQLFQLYVLELRRISWCLFFMFIVFFNILLITRRCLIGLNGEHTVYVVKFWC